MRRAALVGVVVRRESIGGMRAMGWAAFVGVVLVAALAHTSAAGVPPCRSGVVLAGERDLVDELEPILRERGIAVAAADGTCAPLRAELVRGGARIVVWIVDPDGRRADRVVEDAQAAATVIESWTRRDLVDPLFEPRSVIPVHTAATATPSVALAVAPEPEPRFTLLAAADAGVSGDGALWSGVRAQGCAVVGRTCIGGAVRYAVDLERTGDAHRLGNGRSAFGVAFLVGVPLRAGRTVVTPGLGAGLTSVTAQRAIDPSDTDGKAEVEQASSLDLHAGCAVALRVARSWSLRLDASLTVAPFARTRLGDPTMANDQLAAQPTVAAWLGLGVVFGGLR